MHLVLTALMTLSLLLGGFGAVVSAQPPKDRAKFRERLEVITMWKMMESMDLDKTTADKIFEIRHKLVGQRDTLEKEIRKDIETLRAKLRDEPAKVSDAELTQLLNSVREKRKKLESLKDKQYEQLSKVLSPRQQAQMVLFLKDFHREIRAMLRSGVQDGRLLPTEMSPCPPGDGPPPFSDRLKRRSNGEGPPLGPGPRPPAGPPPAPPGE